MTRNRHRHYPPVSTGLYPPAGALSYIANVSAAEPADGSCMFDTPSGIRICTVGATNDNALPQRHIYSTMPAFNASGTMVNLGLASPNRKMRVGSRPYTILQNDQGNTSTLWWYCTNPLLAWCTNGADNGIRKLNISAAGVVSVASTLAAATINASYLEVRPGGVQGGSDDSDTYLAYAWKDNTAVTANYGIGVLNLTTGAIHASRTMGTMPAANALSTVIDNCGTSHTGSWVWFTWVADGAGVENGMWVYERDLNVGTRRQISISQEHCDWATTRGGLDRFVWWNAGAVTSTDPNTGTNTTLLSPVQNGTHISGRAFLRPGWVTVSQSGVIYTDPGAGHVFNLSIDTPGLAEDWGSLHRTQTGAYEEEPHACPSPDGTRIITAGKWEAGAWIRAYIRSVN